MAMQSFREPCGPAESLRTATIYSAVTTISITAALVALSACVTSPKPSASSDRGDASAKQAGSAGSVATLSSMPDDEDGEPEVRFDRSAVVDGPCRVSLAVTTPDGVPAAEGRLWVGGLVAVDANTVTILQRGPMDIADGNVVLERLGPGGLSVVAVSGELVAVSVLLVDEICQASPAELQLQEGRVLEGRVVDSAGEGVTGASLRVRALSVDFQLPTAEDGSFRHVVPSITPIGLQAVAPGLASSELRLSPSDEPRLPMMFRVEPSTAVRVDVRHADGVPAKGVIVRFRWGSEMVAGVTDHTGSASFERVAPTLVDMELAYFGLEMGAEVTFEGAEPAQGAEIVLEIEFPPLGALVGRASDDEGETVGPLWISAAPRDISPRLRPSIGPQERLPEAVDSPTARLPGLVGEPEDPALHSRVGALVPVDRDGSFRLVLPAGSWELSATSRDGRRGSVEVEIIGGRVLQDIGLVLREEAAARGRSKETVELAPFVEKDDGVRILGRVEFDGIDEGVTGRIHGQEFQMDRETAR